VRGWLRYLGSVPGGEAEVTGVVQTQQHPILIARNLRREFGRKRFVAVRDVSFEVMPGQVVCLLGPNGAGKTTTVKLCSTILTPTSGELEAAGVDAVKHHRQARQKLGLVLGGEKGFYLRATAQDNLLFFADVANVPGRDRIRRVEDALDAVSLRERCSSAVQEFSRGMRQRLHLARALLNRPPLLLLDEPTTGLDPELAVEFRGLVRSLANSGVGILLTTHYLAEAEELSDRLLILQSGAVRVDGSASDISAAAQISVVTTPSFARPVLAVRAALEQLCPHGRYDIDALYSRSHVRLIARPGDDHADTIERLCILLGESPTDVITRRPMLEESYLELLAQQPEGREDDAVRIVEPVGAVDSISTTDTGAAETSATAP
jgi:ABC-2 type transport system ATP-binding protein